MAQLSYRDAVAAGIAQEMRRDERVVLFGEDTAAAGGVFKTTVGLFEEFGPRRVRDTPISELAILGAAMGAAMTGLRPVAEIMFSDFLACCWDYVANEIAKTRYMSDGQITIPLVIRTANGGGARFGAQHSQSVENWAMAYRVQGRRPVHSRRCQGLLAAASGTGSVCLRAQVLSNSAKSDGAIVPWGALRFAREDSRSLRSPMVPSAQGGNPRRRARHIGTVTCPLIGASGHADATRLGG
jgi:hypothetical protein